jgi:uncharacterized protein
MSNHATPSQGKPPSLGFGLGLRPQHYGEILDPALDGRCPADWFEIISENYMVAGGQPRRRLDQICERFPVVMHSVAMSLASTAPLNHDYLRDLKALARRVKPRWISDHLAWTGVGGYSVHDLLPVPYNRESLKHVIARIVEAQDFLGQRIVIENASSYVVFARSDIPEWEFVGEMAERADCWLLLDVNNVYVNSFNHGFDPRVYLDAIPPERVVQLHVAGHTHRESHIIDTHDAQVCPEVWELFAHAIRRFWPVSPMIERDDNIPGFRELADELAVARRVAAEALPGLIV